MYPRNRKFLGLMLDEKTIRVAEVRTSSHGTAATAVAEFAFPEGLSLNDPARMGAALADFLKANHLTARKTVIGIPAKWVMTRERTLPPASGDALLSMVRLEAERCFAISADHLTVDAAIAPPSSQGVHVLLAAVSREYFDRICALASAANLKIVAITPTTLQLARMAKERKDAAFFVTALSDYAELTTHTKEHPVALRHIPIVSGKPSAEQQKDFALALAQASASLSADTENATSFVAWDGAIRPRTPEALSHDFSLKIDAIVNLKSIPLSEIQVPQKDDGRFVGAVALALSGVKGNEAAINFWTSHLQKQKQHMRFRPIAWAAAVALAFVIAFIIFLLDWRSQQVELADMKQRLEEMQPDIETAESIVEQVRMARHWTYLKPSFLEPMKALTEAFPWEDKIWITNMAIGQNKKCAISGKSSDERSILTLLNNIRKASSFDEVKLLYMRDAGGTSSDTAFSITFILVGEE